MAVVGAGGGWLGGGGLFEGHGALFAATAALAALDQGLGEDLFFAAAEAHLWGG